MADALWRSAEVVDRFLPLLHAYAHVKLRLTTGQVIVFFNFPDPAPALAAPQQSNVADEAQTHVNDSVGDLYCAGSVPLTP